MGLGRNKKVVQGKVGRHVLAEGLDKLHHRPSKSQQRCPRGSQMDPVEASQRVRESGRQLRLQVFAIEAENQPPYSSSMGGKELPVASCPQSSHIVPVF